MSEPLFKDAMEPVAQSVLDRMLALSGETYLDHTELHSVCATSMAQSAKRQADALEAIADRLKDLASGEGIIAALRTPLNHYGEGIGECIAGQFERSGR